MQLTQSQSGSKALDVVQVANQLAAMSRQDMPVAVRNNLSGIASFTDENTGHNMTWEAADDPAGKDVREVPPSMLLNPQFRENVLRGIFSVEEDPSVLQDALMRQRGDWDARQLEASGAQATIESAAMNTIASGSPCIAPRNARELCGNYSVVMGKDPSEAPPLCGEHEHLAGNYAPKPSGRVVNGKPEILWTRK